MLRIRCVYCGVRDEEDLRRLGGLGCDAVLVATALLNGSLRA